MQTLQHALPKGDSSIRCVFSDGVLMATKELRNLGRMGIG